VTIVRLPLPNRPLGAVLVTLLGLLGEALGQLYVAQYFPPDSKRKMLVLVENLRAAYAERIQHLMWMSSNTKRVALEKLAAFRPKIGYPDKWRDFSPGRRCGDLCIATSSCARWC